jgi:hypothetical protein
MNFILSKPLSFFYGPHQPQNLIACSAKGAGHVKTDITGSASNENFRNLPFPYDFKP